MKPTQKLRLMQNLNEKYIEEAEETVHFSSKKKIWQRGLSIAACAILVCGISVAPFWNMFQTISEEKEKNDRYTEENSLSWTTSDEGQMICVYDDGDFDYVPFSFFVNKSMEDSGILVMPEAGDIKFDNDVYAGKVLYYCPILTYDQDYSYVYRKVKLDHIEKKIGETTVQIGWNEETQAEIVCTAEMYAIRGIDTQYAIAVKPDVADPYVRHGNLNDYLLWYRKDVYFADFAELIKAYHLKEQFYVGPAFVEGLMTGTGIVENIIYPNEENRIFCEKLLAVNGNTVENSVVQKDRAHIDIDCGFLVTGGAFGMKIYEDGYLVTNIGGTLHTFDIGKGMAAELITYGKSIPEPFCGVEYFENGSDMDETEDDGAMTLPYDPTAALE